jgi:PDZ domain
VFRTTFLVVLLCACGARADAPAADLNALKEAVRAADKRGANVEPIKAALAALERANGANAELDALRAAVEAAHRKGENVEAVSDALGAVERALTGKAFERPKAITQGLPPEPKFTNPNPKPRVRVPPNPEPNRGLGVRTFQMTPFVAFRLGLEPATGLAVKSVVPDSPADKAGLKANDLILEFNGQPPGKLPTDFTRRVMALEPNEKLDFVLLRNGERVTIKGIQLPGAPDDAVPAPRPKNPANP